MRILFVCSQLPYPPINGILIKLYNALRLMAQENQVALAVLTRDPYKKQQKVIEHLESFCEKIIVVPLHKQNRLKIATASLLREKLFYLSRYRDQSFIKVLEEMVRTWHPDVIHFDLIIMSQYGSTVNSGTAKVVSINDSYSLALQNELDRQIHRSLWQRIYTRLQLKFTHQYESTAYTEFDYCHVVSDLDAAHLKKLNPAIPVVTIPNGVDINYFRSLKTQQSAPDKTAVFVANFCYGNTRYLEDFLVNVWQVVRSQLPKAHLFAIGNNPPSKPQRIGSSVGGVSFPGYVEDLRDYYSQALIVVTPVRKNCGILNKTLEGMAMGLTVVGFTESFCGIPKAKHGRNCVMAENNEQLATEIIKLFKNPERALSIGRSARKLVENDYSWESRKQLFTDMYQQAIRKHHNNIEAEAGK